MRLAWRPLKTLSLVLVRFWLNTANRKLPGFHGECKKKQETHLFSDVLAAFQVVISIRQNLRLYDGNNAMLKKRTRRCQDKANT